MPSCYWASKNRENISSQRSTSYQRRQRKLLIHVTFKPNLTRSLKMKSNNRCFELFSDVYSGSNTTTINYISFWEKQEDQLIFPFASEANIMTLTLTTFTIKLSSGLINTATTKHMIKKICRKKNKNVLKWNWLFGCPIREDLEFDCYNFYLGSLWLTFFF